MKIRIICICIFGFFIIGCAITPNIYMEHGNYVPDINPDNFVEVIDNPYMPMIPGTVKILEAKDQGDVEKVVTLITYEKKEIMGISCTVMWDRAYENGVLIEDTYDWFAQDIYGNVWYFGEYSAEYEDGIPVSFEGSWEAGVNGALPGIVMIGEPHVGDAYRQEYLEGEAEDMGEVLSLDKTVKLPDGTVFENCIKTKDWNPNESWIVEYKYYAPGTGVVLEEEPDKDVWLYEITTIEEYDIEKLINDDKKKPLGLEVFIEAGVDAVNDDERMFYITPGIEWEVFNTGLTLGFEWEVLLAPDPEVGEITLNEEYEIEFDAPVLLYFGNENTVFLGEMPQFNEDGEKIEAIERFEGFLYMGVQFIEIPYIEIDFTYLPEIELGAVFGAEKEFYLRKGNFFGVSGAFNFMLVEEFAIGDLEFDAYYTHRFDIATFTVGAEPVVEIEKLENESKYEAGFIITPYTVLSFSF